MGLQGDQTHASLAFEPSLPCSINHSVSQALIRVKEITKTLTACCSKPGMAICLLAAYGSAYIIAANKEQDSDMQPMPSQRNSPVVSYTFSRIQARHLVKKMWLHVTRHGHSIVQSMSTAGEPKAGCFGRRPAVIVPVGALKRSAGGCIALSCTTPPVTHRVPPAPTGRYPCRCRMHCVTLTML